MSLAGIGLDLLLNKLSYLTELVVIHTNMVDKNKSSFKKRKYFYSRKNFRFFILLILNALLSCRQPSFPT